MAPDWRRIALAAVAAAALAVGCLLSGAPTQAQEAEAEAEAEQSEAKPEAKAPAPGKKKNDPAEARRAVDAAAKLLESGKAEQAGKALTATLTAGHLPPPVLAKAFYVRGMAYRQQGKTADAISDLTNALWLKGGLGGAERADAIKQRAAAYRDAGLADGGEVASGASNTGAKSNWWWGGETGSTGASSSSSTSGQAKSGWFGNLLNWGSSSSTPPPAPPPAAKAPDTTAAFGNTPEPPPPPAAKVPKVSSSSWARGTEVKAQHSARAEPDVAAPPPAPPPKAPPPAAKAEGKYKVQLATVRTQAEAMALAAKAKREHAAALANREPEIDQAVLGNMGAFYRVRVGPFATAQETQAVCARLKGSGFDCMSVTR